jgi:predicted tellurium resistance membrane protein TerC
MIINFDSVMSLLFLIVIEVVLGIDNLIFLAILTERLPLKMRVKIRGIGLTGAWVMRLALLFSAIWITKAQKTLFSIYSWSFSLADLFFIAGGVFLVYQSLIEIGNELEFLERKLIDYASKSQKDNTLYALSGLVIQIILMDLVFSLDSIFTAVAISKEFFVMSLAITVSIIVMFYATEQISKFIHQHPSIKMLALAFLVMIGIFLMMDGFKYQISRSYLYFSMFFSFMVECLNILHKRRNARY